MQRQPTGFGTGKGNVIEQWLNAYDGGDVNRPEDLDKWRKGDWGWLHFDPKAGEYLAHVKSLLTHWPHLQLLADFMDAGTTPVRWNSKVPGGYPEDRNQRHAQRKLRMARTRVSVLEYPLEDGSGVMSKEFTTSPALNHHLTGLAKQDSSEIKLRLYVVEDLSRDVIEALGGHYDVNPSFFREHIADNVWHNIKDWWREPPNLDIVSRSQNWFQMRFSRSRYFFNKDAYETAEHQAYDFNVFRQLQPDYNQSKLWDTNKDDQGTHLAKVGHLRSKVTFWMKTPKLATTAHDIPQTSQVPAGQNPTIGILLLDPTIEEGNPVWMQYRNWSRVPSMSEKIDDKTPLPEDSGPKQKSFYEDFIYWATHPNAFSFNPESPTTTHTHHHDLTPSPSSPVCIPTQALLHMVGTEWLTLVEYIKTRVNQIDWEIAFPDHFLTKDEQIEKALGKLHYWRRVVPIYRAMLAETFLRVFREAKHPDRMRVGTTTVADHMAALGGDLGAGNDVLGDCASILTATARGGGVGRTRGPGSALDALLDRECINAYKQDYTLILNYLEEYQSRIDRLTEVVTAVISIQDSRRGYKDNKNLQWLTWLATFFIPLSFVATMLSMTTEPLVELRDAAVMWAEVSIPSGLVIMCVVLAMSFSKSRRAVRKSVRGFPWFGQKRPFDRGKKSS